MAIQSVELDPNAQAYTDDEIVEKVNSAAEKILATALEEGAAKANLDAMDALDRGYVQVVADVGDFIITAVKRKNNGKIEFFYDDVPVE